MYETPPEGADAKLGVSIVLYRPDYPVLEQTLHSLKQALGGGSGSLVGRTEILLVDHSPQPLTPDGLDHLRNVLGGCARLEYEFAGTNPGFGTGHNNAFRQLKGARGAPYFLVANPDLEFAADGLARSVMFLDEHPEIGLLAPALLEPDGSIRPACFRYPDPVTLLSRWIGGPWSERRSIRYECRDWAADRVRFDPPLVSGCCMLFRSAAFARLQGFDPGYFLYFEDFDLSLRARDQVRSVYYPGMVIRHAGGGAGRKGLRHVGLFIRSAWRFFSTYGWFRRATTSADETD